MANKAIKGITIEIGGDTTSLGAALDDAEKQSAALAAELRNIDRALQADPENAQLLQQQYEVLGEAVEAARQKLATLRNAQEQIQRQFENGDITAAQYRAFQREILSAESAVQRLVQRQSDLQNASDDAAGGVEETAEQLSEMADSADNAGSGIEDLSALTVAKGQLMADAIKKVASELINIADNTRELREDLAKLDNNATSSGKNIDTMREALKNLNAITGETDSNIEALSNLMATGMSENQMLQALNDLSGAVIAFPDTLKIESLADGLQETLATGAGAGAFAELMERSGKNIDDFNAGLEDAMQTGSQYEYVLRQLADTGLARVNRAYRENNQVLIDAKNAQFEIEQVTARVGAMAEETITSVKGDLANLITENIDGIESAIRKIGTVVSSVTKAVSEHKDVILSSAVAYGTFVGVLKTAEGVSGLIAAMKALTTANQGAAAAQGLLNTVMMANPYVLAAAAIAALAAGIAVYAANVETADKTIKSVKKSAEELNAQIEENNAKTESDVAKIKLLKDTYESLRKKYEETGEGLDDLRQVTEDLQALSPTTINFIDEETGKYKDLSAEIGNVVDQLYKKRAVDNAVKEWENAAEAVDILREKLQQANAEYYDPENQYIDQSTDGYRLKGQADDISNLTDIYTEAMQRLTTAEKNLEQAYSSAGIPDATDTIELTVGTNAKVYEDMATRDANNYRASIIKADNAKKAAYRKFKAEQEKLKYTYDTADIQDDDWYYGELEKLLQTYGDDSIEEYHSYYVEVASYKRKQRENDISSAKKTADEQTAIAKQSATDRLAIIKNEVEQTQKAYQDNYNDLINKRKAYEDKLSSMSDIFVESKQTDKNGESKDVFELLDLEKGNQAIEAFDDKLAALEKRNISKGLSDYILSLSADQGNKMMEILSNMSDTELAAYNQAFDKRADLIKERSEKRFASQFEDINKTFMIDMSEIFAGASEEAQNFGADAIDSFIAGFGGNTDAAVAAVSAWADTIVTQMEDNISNGISNSISNIDDRINTALANRNVSVGTVADVTANVDTSNVTLPTNTEIKQSITEQVVISPDLTGLDKLLQSFSEGLSNVSLGTDDIKVDVDVKGTITDAAKNKLIDLITDRIAVRSMISGKEAYSY